MIPEINLIKFIIVEHKLYLHENVATQVNKKTFIFQQVNAI